MDNVITRGPRDYAYPDIPFNILPDWYVADIGPGNYPLYRADWLIDHDPDNLDRIMVERGYDETTMICSELQDGLPQIKDKFFDYVWCSHVLEHVDDPATCVRTLSRIGKRGTIVVPSAIKEAWFHFEERDHKWLILPRKSDGMLMFIGYYMPFMQRLRDTGMQQSSCRLLRTGTGHECPEANYGREWFSMNEKYGDLIYHWEGEAEIMVIQ